MSITVFLDTLQLPMELSTHSKAWPS